MPELRWTLLLLGILFLAGLAWWELRKTRGGDRQNLPGSTALPREPALGLPEIRPREPARELPVIEIEDDAAEPESFEPIRPAEPISPPEPSGPLGPVEAAPPAPLVPEERPVPAPAQTVVVEWPPEAERRLIGVRLVATLGERYPGRQLRQALAAAGLVHGRFGIFHFPAPDGRAAFSVASLTKPGNFELETMDAQRYAGLSLFAVFPGPLAPAETIDLILHTARDLTERLGGALQDDRGQPLSPARVAELRVACAASEEQAP